MLYFKDTVYIFCPRHIFKQTSYVRMAIKDEIKAFIKAIIFDHVDPYLHFLDKLSWQQILNMNRQIAINKLTLIGG